MLKETNMISEVKNTNRHMLWENNAPGAIGNDPEDKPWFSLHLPEKDKANGAAVVICPGGGYSFVCDTYEGEECAEWLNSFGVAAVVLRYRIAPRYRYPSPMVDAKRMMRVFRAKSAEWGIDQKRIGIWGFSAGGHLAASVGTDFDLGNSASSDPVERISCRPDFMILSYPVITGLKPYVETGSFDNLLGKDADPKQLKDLSLELNVTKDTPPSFIFHTTADNCVPVENSVIFYMALCKCGVPAEMHLYKDGRHGVGLSKDNEILANWTIQLKNWFTSQGLIR